MKDLTLKFSSPVCRKAYAAITMIFAAALSFAEPAPVSFSGKLESHYAAGFRGENAGDCIKGGFSAEGQIKGFSGESSFYSDGNLEYDSVTAAGVNHYDAALREAWFDYNGSWYSFRIGRQISAWGAADGLIVCDVLCPQNDNAFLAEKISESRLGIDAVRFSLMNSSIIFDAYVIPFFTPEEIPESEKDLMHDYVFPSAVQKISIEKPSVSLSSMEYAFRLSTYLSALDFSFYGFYGFQDQPVFQLASFDPETGKTALSGSYRKYFMLGFDSSIPAGDFTIRTEAAFFPQKCFSTSNLLETERRWETKALLGLDWIHGDWTITGQYYADFISGNVSDLSEDPFSHEGTVNISYSLSSSNLEFSLSGVVNLNDFDSYLEPAVKYSWSDSIGLSLSGKIFTSGPESDGTYGEYKDLSCIILKGTYSF